MIHKHFSTSRKHGAVYDIEDLMAVTLVNDDLRGFITRWDAVIAGMTSEPDTMWKQAYFHNAIKNFKPLSHDLAVYDRTPEGEPNRPYEFLMKAARDYLERKRLEKMRQATKKSLSGKREAAPAPNRPPSAGKSMRSLTKAKVQVRKVNLGPSQEALVVLCLLDLGIKFANFGRRGSVTMVVIVLFSIRRSLQLRLQKTTGVGRVRTRGSRRRVTVPGHRSRFQLLEGLSESQGQRGKTIFLRFSCSLPDARSDDGRSDQPFDCREASPPLRFTTSILQCQLHPTALFHLGTTLKSLKFPLSMIAI